MSERDDDQQTRADRPGTGPQAYGGQQYGTQAYGAQPHGAQPYGPEGDRSGPGAPQYWPAQPAQYPPYGPPSYGPAYLVQRSTNGMAVASMVLGILWIYWIGSILALVFGYVARQQIKQRGESGDGMAIAGIVLGYVGLGLPAVVLLIGVSASTF